MYNYTKYASLNYKDTTATYNIGLAKDIGVVPAILFSNLLYLDSIFTEKRIDGYFYTTREAIEKHTAIKRDAQIRAFKKLKEIGLVDYKRLGVPAKMYYRIVRHSETPCLDVDANKCDDINVSKESDLSPDVAKRYSSNHIDNQSSTKTNESINKSTNNPVSLTKPKNHNNKLFSTPDVVGGIIIYLNNVLGTHFRNSETNSRLIKKLFANKYTVNDIKFVIDNKFAEWHDDPKMAKYLRPSTLFRESNFDKYVNEPVFKKVSKWDNFGKEVIYHTATKPAPTDDDVTGEKM